jgi:hypothetical protein
MFLVLFWFTVTGIAGLGFFTLLDIIFDWTAPPDDPIGVQAARRQLEIAQLRADIEDDAIRLRRELDEEIREIGDRNG